MWSSLSTRCFIGVRQLGGRPLMGVRFKSDLVVPETHSDGRVLKLTLNDPKTRNSLSLAMLESLHSHLQTASTSDTVSAVIFASRPPVFSAGHNLKELTSETGVQQHEKIFNTCTDFMQLIQDCSVPCIAQVDGLAAAAGCQLVASCDIVVCTPQSSFSTPGARVAGLFCSTPGVAVARAVPRRVALDMLLTGDPIDAEAALRAGLVSRIVDADRLSDECLKIADTIASLSKPVIGLGKAFFWSQADLDRHTAYRHAQVVMIENLRLKDCQEGIKSFIEKRKPNWSHTADRAH